MTFDNFVTKHHVTLSRADRVVANPNMADDQWARQASHYKVEMERRAQIVGVPRVRRMSVYYSMGSAHTQAPKLLESLAMDAQGFDNSTTFESWAEEVGLNTDSRKAEQTYNAVRNQTAKMRKFLGEAGLADLLTVDFDAKEEVANVS